MTPDLACPPSVDAPEPLASIEHELGVVRARLAGMDMKDMPFDGRRMIYGGFKAMVSM